MKKLHLTLIALLFSFTCLKAQDYKYQIKVGVGDGTMLSTGDLFINAFDAIILPITGVTREDNYSTSYPYIFVDYRYGLSEIVGLGLQVGFMGIKNEATIKNINNGSTKNMTYNSSYVAVMPGVDVRYYQNNKFKLYGNAMLGMLFMNRETDTGKQDVTGFMFQVNPIGASYGDKIAVFAEAGFGISIANLGVRFGL